jgi:hypothetical protein
VFLPNLPGYRSGWGRATDVEEVFTGTVILPLPDNGPTFIQASSSPNTPCDPRRRYRERRRADLFGGGRFVADQITNGYYRIPVPGGVARWGWVKPASRLVVYPQLTHPALDLAALPRKDSRSANPSPPSVNPGSAGPSSSGAWSDHSARRLPEAMAGRYS